MSRPEKGNRRRKKSYDNVAVSYMNAYGKEYCPICQHMRDIQKLVGQDGLRTQCKTCGATITIINKLERT